MCAIGYSGGHRGVAQVNESSLYRQVLGAGLDRLPAAVQRFHTLSGSVVLQGQVETRAPHSWIARSLALLVGSPRSDSRGPLRFELQAAPASETWTRHFPARTMRSQLFRVGHRLEERLGAARLLFELTARDTGLGMRLVDMRFFGVPCPSWLMPSIVAEEWGHGNALRFRVVAEAPFVGMLTHYEGHLDVPARASS